MNGMLQPPSATAFDAVASVVSLLVYLVVAAAALARAPRDTRARVFMAVALTSAVPYAVAPLQWWNRNAAATPMVIAAVAVSFSLGSVALFHLTQVFPARRPWIGADRGWLVAAYALPPVPVAAIAWFVGRLTQQMGDLAATGSGGLGAVSDDGTIAIVMLLMLPLIFVIGIMLPFAAMMSLFKSWQEARLRHDEAGRRTTLWMLISQLGGGVLAVLVLPLLHLIGVGAPWAAVIGALTYAFALLMPVAFARAVWRYGIISTSA